MVKNLGKFYFYFESTDTDTKDMKPTLAADEMFPEGAGYMDMEEVSWYSVVIRKDESCKFV